ncbi:hypothetical protein L484_003904 [Morus notabilis]|uniref:Uncharacterized protein n=1 Tax=Morus notabilis TaxID=981085 RepID=W9QNY0_9ROSA|nr:hypothetical protein L484_003904 [Morus notabilis]
MFGDQNPFDGSCHSEETDVLLEKWHISDKVDCQVRAGNLGWAVSNGQGLDCPYTQTVRLGPTQFLMEFYHVRKDFLKDQ